MARSDDLAAPLYTVQECDDELREINKNLRALGRRPVRAVANGTGSADYTGRMAELRKERTYWTEQRKLAVAYERAKRGGRASIHNGPRQVME